MRVSITHASAASEDRATVGHFVRIDAGGRGLMGVITEVEKRGEGALARVDVMGETFADAMGRERFRRGVINYPAIGDMVISATSRDLRLIFASDGPEIGCLYNDESVPARLNLPDAFNKHFAVLGSTGVGKSSGVAVILGAALAAVQNTRIFLLDGHNEFGRCFGSKANVVSSKTLKLPFWLFAFEEFIDVVYAGRPAVEEELEILAEHIPMAKGMYQAQRALQTDRLGFKKLDPKRAGYTVDTPVPYQMENLIGLIDERMGKLENRATRMHCHRLMSRLEALKNDQRYGFMFENANVGGDTMADILSNLFRLDPGKQPMTVMQLAGLPAEVVDAVVCVLARMAFDFGLWSDGAIPMLFVCEEAHRFAPADRKVGFAPTRRALMRLAKEGRKYGICLGLVTQRPGEIDPTIISQCGTLFAMRLANDRDQALLRSAVSDSVADLLNFVPSLGVREAVAFGDGVALPTRLRFSELPAERVPRAEAFRREDEEPAPAETRAFVRSVVERWRGAAGATKSDEAASEAPAAPAAHPEPRPPSPDPSSAAARLEQLRTQLLKRTSGLT